MTLNSEALIEAVASHAMTTGRFEQVNQYEAKNKVTSGLFCDVTVVSGVAIPLASGLDVTAALVVMSVVAYANGATEPMDGTEVALLNTVDDLLTLYNGDFTLDGLIRNVDIMGAYGPPLGWTMGHMDRSGGPIRAAEITLPLVINDAWDQEA